jgi:hypothetical protein
MLTNGQDSTRPDPTHSDWIQNATLIPGKPDRATYEASRRAELDRIRLIDIKRRQLLGYFRPLGGRRDDDLWDRDDFSRQDREEHDEAARELQMSQRILVHAVEGYLLGCVELSSLTGEVALKQTRSTEELCAVLQAEEDLSIKTFGPPWAERPPTSNESLLHGFPSGGTAEVPTRESAASATPALWNWPWR